MKTQNSDQDEPRTSYLALLWLAIWIASFMVGVQYGKRQVSQPTPAETQKVEVSPQEEISPAQQEEPAAVEAVQETVTENEPDSVQVIATNRVHITTHFNVAFESANNQ